MMRNPCFRFGCFAVIGALLSAPSFAQYQAEPGKGAPEKLGKVVFATSCDPKVQAQFERGVALLHSFWFSEGRTAFEAILKQDPQCAIAYWGLAVNLLLNPLAGTESAKNLEIGWAGLEKAREIGAKTERERDWIDAISALYRDYEKVSYRDRQLAYEKAMERLSQKYPDDTEAAVYYALALNATALRSDLTYANQLKAAGILEGIYQQNPNHPGVAHYLIHGYDAPALADKGMPAARRYAGIAPSVPHALHMPSHIFTRTGAWQESIDTNARCAESSVRGNEPDEHTHCNDYALYGYLQLAQDGSARKVLADSMAVSGFNASRMTAPYALAAGQARMALERGAWKEAAQLAVTQSVFANTEAITYFARGIGAARSGDAAAAEKEVQQLVLMRDALRAKKDNYWATEVEVQRLAVAAWTVFARGSSAEEALALMRQAADLEDKSEKHIVTPARMLPARELLGDMLMALKQPAAALTEYEKSFLREPNRFRGFAGAAQAAADAGDTAKARKYFSQLVALAGGGEARPELVRAKAYLAGNR
jgi:tetratricopeptide (TPR) repeat protein